jgi:hypothetical protein
MTGLDTQLGAGMTGLEGLLGGLGGQMTGLDTQLGAGMTGLEGLLGGLGGQMTGLDTQLGAGMTGLEGLLGGLGGQIGGLGSNLGGQISGLGRQIGTGFDNMGDLYGGMLPGLDNILNVLNGPSGLDTILGGINGLPTLPDIEGILGSQGLPGDLPGPGGTELSDEDLAGLIDLLTGGGTGGEPWNGDMTTLTPNLPEFQPIDDYSQMLQHPLMASALSNLTAANPYDTRRDSIINGQMSRVDEFYDDAMAKLENKYGVLGKLGLPIYREELRKLEDQRARAKGDIESQFGMSAAGAEQGLQSSRIGDLGSVLTQELGRQEQLVNQQRNLRSDAMGEYNDFFDRYMTQYNQPQTMSDEGLRLLLGGLGVSLQPGQALSGAVGAGGNAVSGNTGILNALLQYLNM